MVIGTYGFTTNETVKLKENFDKMLREQEIQMGISI